MTAPPPDGEGAARAYADGAGRAQIAPEASITSTPTATSTDIGDVGDACLQTCSGNMHNTGHQRNQIDDWTFVRRSGAVEMAACP